MNLILIRSKGLLTQRGNRKEDIGNRGQSSEVRGQEETEVGSRRAGIKGLDTGILGYWDTGILGYWDGWMIEGLGD